MRDQTAPRAAVLPASQSQETKQGPHPLDLLTGTVGYAINRAEVRCYQELARRLPADISPARLTALSLIATNPGLTQAALGAMLNIASPSVVKVVNALESAGYVERTAIDRRSFGLTVTRLGTAQLVKTRKVMNAYEADTTTHLSEAERQTLIELLGRVARYEN